MEKYFKVLATIGMLFFLSGCAGMIGSDFEPPTVSLKTFRIIPQQSVSPRFEIGLRVINPNRDPLHLKGIYYTVKIEKYQILAGVANNLPTVEPYGEAEIMMVADVDLVRGIKLISSLMQEPRDVFKYSFEAKLDPGGLNRKITIKEEGELNLRNGM